MTPETPNSNNLSWRWVGTTTLGWLLGFIVLVALASLADLVGFHGQFMVGVGIGAGVGLLQGRALSSWVRPVRWMMASMIGMGSLFVLHDVVQATGVGFPYSLPLYVLVGALVVGIWQWHLLRAVSERAHWWIPTSLLAWALPVGASRSETDTMAASSGASRSSSASSSAERWWGRCRSSRWTGFCIASGGLLAVV